MLRIRNIYRYGLKNMVGNTLMANTFTSCNSSVSFEFFPPKTAALEEGLWENLIQLASLNPSFVSVTYGAGGTTRERTHAVVARIANETHLKPAAHLTCVAASKEDINQVAHDYWDSGVRHIVALRGDPPGNIGGKYTPHPEGYRYACDLIKGVQAIGPFEISVAAFPEKHPESASFEEDMKVLKGKQDAGASRAITQYFFDVEHYMRYLERARKAGITIPIIPGLLPVGNYTQMCRFSKMCGASVPEWVHTLFAGLDDSPEIRDKVAVDVAAEQCRKLREFGVNHFHFYTLNRAELVMAICATLGIKTTAAPT